MARHDNFNMTMKDFPGARRVTTENGRVWLFDGKQFATKREMYLYKFPPKLSKVSDVHTPENPSTGFDETLAD